MSNLLTDLYGKAKSILENRPAKVRHRLELLAKREQLRGQLQPAVEAAELEQRRIRDVLAGVFVTAAQKQLARALAPIDTEINTLTRTLQNHLPEVAEACMDELRRKENALRAQFDAVEIVSQAMDGSWLEKVLVDRGSVETAIDVVRAKMSEVGSLCLLDLTASELRARIEAIRSQPLPILKKRRLQREHATADYQESVA